MTCDTFSTLPRTLKKLQENAQAKIRSRKQTLYLKKSSTNPFKCSDPTIRKKVKIDLRQLLTFVIVEELLCEDRNVEARQLIVHSNLIGVLLREQTPIVAGVNGLAKTSRAVPVHTYLLTHFLAHCKPVLCWDRSLPLNTISAHLPPTLNPSRWTGTRVNHNDKAFVLCIVQTPAAWNARTKVSFTKEKR